MLVLGTNTFLKTKAASFYPLLNMIRKSTLNSHWLWLRVIFSMPSILRISLIIEFDFWCTSINRLFRSNEVTFITGDLRFKLWQISFRTDSVAVAVIARNGTPGKTCRSLPSVRYESRKSWPHWLTQCASSMATHVILTRWLISRIEPWTGLRILRFLKNSFLQ